jgi:hypothetical protein
MQFCELVHNVKVHVHSPYRACFPAPPMSAFHSYKVLQMIPEYQGHVPWPPTMPRHHPSFIQMLADIFR